MADPLEQLVDSLLFEGYALYPYTPGATKNATPTPFGIVYPTAYAQTLSSTFDHLELRCGLQAPPDGVLRAQLRFLVADGERHQAAARRIDLPGGMVGALALQPAEKQARIETAQGPGLVVGLRLSADALDGGGYEVTLRIENRTVVRSGLDRAAALGALAALRAPDPAGRRRALHLAAGAPVRQRQHVPGARDAGRRRGHRRGDRAAGPPADSA